MKLIIGLGNPEEKYKNNRHNAGHLLVSQLAQQMARFDSARRANGTWRVEKKFNAEMWGSDHSLSATCHELLLAKPTTFMNDSGKSVKKLVDFYFGRNKVLRGRAGSYKVDLDDLYVAYDDLDIPLGQYKISKGKSPRQHNGIDSVKEVLGTDNFWHVRIGVDNRKPKNRVQGVDYVLQDLSKEEKEVLDEVLRKVVDDLIGRL